MEESASEVNTTSFWVSAALRISDEASQIHRPGL